MNELEASTRGLGYMFSLSLITRLASFSLNLLLSTRSSYHVLGQVLDLELYASTLLFLCRENIRLALLRSSPPSRDKLQNLLRASPQDWEREEHALVCVFWLFTRKAVNFSYVPVILGLTLSRLYFLYQRVYPSTHSAGGMHLYVTSALIELLAEPLSVYAQRHLLFGIRASVEGFSLLSKCILTLLFFPSVASGSENVTRGVMAYAWADILGSCILLVGYILQLSRHASARGPILDFWKSMIPQRSYLTGQIVDAYHVSVAISFWSQSLLKHFLTVGDKMLLMGLGVADDQKGVYRLVSDLGSLIARVLFQPVEETCRTFFSKSLAGKSSKLIGQETDSSEIPKETLETCHRVLTLLLQVHVLLGGFFVFFGPQYTKLLLSILFNATKATPEASRVLGVYCLYVPLMGINGISEAFFQGVGDSNSISQQTRWLIVFWMIFVGTFGIAYKSGLGIAGLVIANMVNLALRIWFSLKFTHLFFQSHGLETRLYTNAWMSFTVLFAFVGALSIMHTASFYTSELEHLGMGIACGIAVLTVV